MPFVDKETVLDFKRALASESSKAHCAAALFLRSEGREGATHLPALLDRCQRVPIDNHSLTVVQERLVSYGARSLGTIVHAIGFESDDKLHKRIKDWLIRLTTNRHIQIAGFAIHSLRDLGIPPLDVQQKLEGLIVGPKRSDDLPTISCRGTAFRVLVAIKMII